jgi:hypothetical protein
MVNSVIAFIVPSASNAGIHLVVQRSPLCPAAQAHVLGMDLNCS